MSRVLITGGTGVLGRKLVPRLAAAGYTVRVMSRRPRPAATDPQLEWARAELRTGEGLTAAVDGADIIVHAASSVWRSRMSDVQGTERLLNSAGKAGVHHLFYISIVGVDKIPYGYYKAKLAAERLIEGSDIPWSILRATQFHSLIDMGLSVAMRLPLAFLPTDFQFQPIAPAEAADRILEDASRGPAGRLPDVGGPEVRTLGELARAWAEARGLRRRTVRLPLPGKIAAGFREGLNCVPERRFGSVTWEDWLRRRYGSP